MKYYPFMHEKPKKKSEPMPLYKEIEQIYVPLKPQTIEKENEDNIIIIELF